MTQAEHVGITALDCERTKLLKEYDDAVSQGSDDHVKTEHGVSCEAHFRAFLREFLPKKYGVTKGYIITPDLDYAGPLEEWDIIIYDAMEAPVLFVRRNHDENERAGKRGIPVEYVRGVVEVKATFSKAMGVKATEKLLKLRQFQKKQDAPNKYGQTHLPIGFRAFSVFFETKVKSSEEYADALGSMAPFWQNDPLIAFAGALFIRGGTCPEYSASASYVMNSAIDARDFKRLLRTSCEVSTPVPSFVPDMNVAVVSGGFGPNEFWKYMIGMIHALNGEDEDLPGMAPKTLTGGYGERISGYKTVPLFPQKKAPTE